MKTQVQTALLSGVIALAGWVAAVDPAAAAVYRGRFDPLYGAPFTDPALAWAGTIEIDVRNSCIGPNRRVTLLNCSGGIQITEATVELFTDGNPISPGDTPTPGLQQIMDFGDASGLLGLNWALQFDANSALIGVNSTAFDAQQGNIAATKYPADSDTDAWFSVQFLGTFAQLYWFDEKPETGRLSLGIPDEVLLTAGGTWGRFSWGGVCRQNGVVDIPWYVDLLVSPTECGWSLPGEDPNGALIQFRQVPEPTTFALVPAALAIMGVVGLRTRRRHSATLAH